MKGKKEIPNMDYQSVIEAKEYDFLRLDPHLSSRIALLCVSGSHAYGTSTPTSDLDIRGIAIENIDALLGLEEFEQYQDSKTDTVIYGLRKFSNLALGCNPNVIELLFLEKEHYLYLSPVGQKILDNRDAFLSQRAIATFAGFASAQLSRLENALISRGGAQANELYLTHLKRSLENTIVSFLEKQSESFSFDLYPNKEEDGLNIDLNIKNMPVSALSSLGGQTSDVIRTYKKGGMGTNARKDDAHLNKHMMHLVRLYLTIIELMENGTFHAYRKEERDLLLDIRNGKYRDENGLPTKEFNELLSSLTQRFEEGKKTCVLPKKADRERVGKMLKEIYEETLFS